MKTIEGNILDVMEGLIAHQVNMGGVMGAGLALQIRDKYPIVFERYSHSLKTKQMQLGEAQIIQVSDRLYVANLAARQNYDRAKGRCYTDYKALEICLVRLKGWMDCFRKPVYLPYGMGAGLAGGDWAKIEELINKTIPESILVRFTP